MIVTVTIFIKIEPEICTHIFGQSDWGGGGGAAFKRTFCVPFYCLGPTTVGYYVFAWLNLAVINRLRQKYFVGASSVLI